MNESQALASGPRVASATRTELIAAARTLFGQRGYDGTSVRAIVQLANANLGAVTYHFGTKRGLYSAVLEEGLLPLATKVIAATESDGSALERIVRVVEVYFDHFEAHPDLPHLLLQEVAAGKEPPGVVKETIGRVKSAISSLQSSGIEDGSVRAGHPVLTALSIVAQPIYLTLVAPLLKSVGDIDLIGDADTRRLALAHTIEFVRAALEPRTREA